MPLRQQQLRIAAELRGQTSMQYVSLEYLAGWNSDGKSIKHECVSMSGPKQ